MASGGPGSPPPEDVGLTSPSPGPARTREVVIQLGPCSQPTLAVARRKVGRPDAAHTLTFVARTADVDAPLAVAGPTPAVAGRTDEIGAHGLGPVLAEVDAKIVETLADEHAGREEADTRRLPEVKSPPSGPATVGGPRPTIAVTVVGVSPSFTVAGTVAPRRWSRVALRSRTPRRGEPPRPNGRVGAPAAPAPAAALAGRVNVVARTVALLGESVPDRVAPRRVSCGSGPVRAGGRRNTRPLAPRAGTRRRGKEVAVGPPSRPPTAAPRGPAPALASASQSSRGRGVSETAAPLERSGVGVGVVAQPEPQEVEGRPVLARPARNGFSLLRVVDMNRPVANDGDDDDDATASKLDDTGGSGPRVLL